MDNIRAKAQKNPVVTTAVVLTISVMLIALVSSPSTESEGTSIKSTTTQNQLKVEGTGTSPQEGVGDTLQGSAKIPQSPAGSSGALQQSGGGLQPAGGNYKPGEVNSLQ